MSFEDALAEELARIPWLDDATGQGFIGAIAADHDTASRELKDAVLMREPLLAPVDALAPLGRDRYVPRAPAHTDATYAAWLDQAPDLWQVAGCEAGYVNVFVPYGFSSATVLVLSNHEVSGAWDGNTVAHSRVFLFLDSRLGPFRSDRTWPEADGDAEPDDVWVEDEGPTTPTWDSTATAADLSYFRETIVLWKGDGAYPTSIAVWLNDNMPDGYWDSPGLWPEDDGDAGLGDVWVEDENCEPLYWTVGNVWGQEAWIAPDATDLWTDGEDEMSVIPEQDAWVAFPGEEE